MTETDVQQTAQRKLEAYISVKWPALVVVGEKVTPDQAAEILVRTASWPLSSNAHRVDAEFNQIAEYPAEPTWKLQSGELREYFERADRASKSLRVLPLQYLHNYRLTSSWIGGPYGWCDWGGNIGCSTHNIGKWPSVDEVTREWSMIAAAFPFLLLRAQVFSGETGEDDVVPTAEWVVADGKVTCLVPAEPLGSPSFSVDHFAKYMTLNPNDREVGATADQVRRGVELARLAPPLPEDEES